MNLSDRYQKFHTSVYAGMYDDLANALGVDANAIKTLGVGYDYKYQAWVIPERNVFGDIIGLSYRYQDGRKTMAPVKSLPSHTKNKRGLVYPFNQQFDAGEKRYRPGRHNWTRVADAGIRCPICDKPDWCLVSSENTSDPQAVICQRIEDGAIKETEGGFLHIRKKSGRLFAAGKLVLPQTELPIIIVEGASDVLAALSLGFVAIGRPNCGASAALLTRMPLSGQEVWVIGENDAGAGIKGMKETFAVVRKLTGNVKMFLPPDGIKDLRQWYSAGLTCEDLIEYAYKEGTSVGAGSIDVFSDAQPATIADAFIDNHKINNRSTFALYNDNYYKWNGTMYTKLNTSELSRNIINFMVGKKITVETANGEVIKALPTTAKWAHDIIFCLQRSCPLTDREKWLTMTDRPGVDQLLSFQNGVLDIAEYLESGNTKLYKSDPDLFVLGSLPYNYNPNVECPEFEDFILSVQDNDEDMLDLLQQWAGYILVPDNSLEKLVILEGQSRSGKGTIVETMKAMLGEDLCTSLKMSNFTTQFGRHCMIGKRLGVFSDVKAPRAGEANVALGYILQIVGGDAINIDKKYADELSNMHLTIRFMMAMNELPTFSDDAMAFAARSLPFQFNTSWEGREDFTLKPRMIKAASEGRLINWALRGLRNLRKAGNFKLPKKTKALINVIRGSNSKIRLFVDELCTFDKSDTVECVLFYKTWKAWCESQGIRAGSREQFGRRLQMAYPTIERGRIRIENERVYVYYGIRLNNKAIDRYID